MGMTAREEGARRDEGGGGGEGEVVNMGGERRAGEWEAPSMPGRGGAACESGAFNVDGSSEGGRGGATGRAIGTSSLLPLVPVSPILISASGRSACCSSGPETLWDGLVLGRMGGSFLV